MNIITNLLTPGASHGRPGYKLTPKGILIHYVGNPSTTADANRNWFENGAGGKHTSAHYIVGLKGEILYIVPENECAQHAAISYAAKYNSTAPKNNSTYLGIEVCHPAADGRFSDITKNALVELCVDICRRHGFDPAKNIMRHYDVTGKICPMYYVNHSAEWAILVNCIIDKFKKEDTEMTQTEFNKMVDTYFAEKAKEGQSKWSADEGCFDKAVAAKILDGTAPRSPLTREQAAAMLVRLGLIE